MIFSPTEDLAAIDIGPGCIRRDLPPSPGFRAWIVELAPGSRWPYVDDHGETAEAYYVISGEVIEGEQRFAAGTYVYFAAGSQHQPRTEIGARLFGFNLAPAVRS